MNIDKLLDDRSKALSVYPDDEYWNKLSGDPMEPGYKIAVHWDENWDNCVDYGYLFALEFCGLDEGDLFCHFRKTENPGGMDEGDPQWTHIRSLMNNDYVEKIVITKV